MLLFVNGSFLIEKFGLKVEFANLFYVLEEIISISLSVFFLSLIFISLNKYEKEATDFDSLTSKGSAKWIRNLLKLGIGIVFVWLLTLLLGIYLGEYSQAINYTLWLGVSFIIYWIGYTGLAQFQINKERVAIRKLINKEDSLSIETNSRDIKSISGLPKTKEKEKFKELERLLKEEHLYRNPNLDQRLLADLLDINLTYLSKLIKPNTGMNFSEYITSYRISEAKKLLSNPEYKNYKIIAIGLEVGFTKASFYRLFKEHTSLTPNEYRVRYLDS